MIKTIYQGDQDELLAQCAGQMSNLVRTDVMYKSAASACFSAKDIAQNMPDKDHFMLHVVAMGAYPMYPSNRNGDAFTKEALLKTHDTFVKFAKFFREHKNTDSSNNMGFVKASAYNHDLDRVELLVHGHKGRAEEEYELAKKGSELSVSMSCKLKNDQCSCCGNEARNLASYCTHLKDSMNQYLPEFRKYAFAFNPDPKFFDISRVRRPADRIAHYLEYVFGDEQDSLQKAASEVHKGSIVIPGAVWANYQGHEEEEQGYELPTSMQKIAQALADKEQWYRAMSLTPQPGNPDYAYAFDLVKRASYVEHQEIPAALEALEPSVLLRKLADAQVIMPLDMFQAYVEGRSIQDIQQDPDYIKAAAALPLLFTSFIKQSSLQDLAPIISAFLPASLASQAASTRNPDEIDDLMSEMECKHSCSLHSVKDRNLNAIAKDHDPRHTYCPDTAECSLNKTAMAYACYQLQTLAHMEHSDIELLGVTGLNRFSVKKD